MIKTNNKRILEFIQWVNDTYPDWVFSRFQAELEECQDIEKAMLAGILESAKKKAVSPNGKTFAEVERDYDELIRKSSLRPCNS